MVSSVSAGSVGASLAPSYGTECGPALLDSKAANRACDYRLMLTLLGPKSLRALLFVRTLNEQGMQPSRSEVKAFVNAPTHFGDFDPVIFSMSVDTVDYLVNARLLISTARGVTLSSAGTAVLNAAIIDDDTNAPSTPIEVVGRLDDPFTYAELLTRINDVPGALVIDPYLRAQDLSALLALPNVRRVMTTDGSAGGLPRAERRTKLQIALGARPGVELRFPERGSRELHDRLVLPHQGGEALSLGTSLGGTQLTVITRLGRESTGALRSHYEGVWLSGQTLPPIHREITDAPVELNSSATDTE
ncbi:hypothetical protein MTE01_32340 [Microbacterium testaceum]|uniref:Uncharacterized protein n=1 Tax=Microbacterium testaceum TaxID=2033 RepID=A0A4Y3QQT5_MICTE|nr:hypothetical protein MTE01_32340 [Microbacterium testaceum]